MMTGWSRVSSRIDHVQLQVSKPGELKPSVCSNSEGWWKFVAFLNCPKKKWRARRFEVNLIKGSNSRSESVNPSFQTFEKILASLVGALCKESSLAPHAA
jgi:hypothetical protein